MENKDKGADAMVMLNMEVEKRILRTLFNMITPENNDATDPELLALRSQTRAVMSLYLGDVLRTDPTVGGMRAEVRKVVADVFGANASSYDTEDTVRYNIQTAVRNSLTGHIRLIID